MEDIRKDKKNFNYYNMKSKYLILSLLLLTFSLLKSQTSITTHAFKALDSSYFKWKEFSFILSFQKNKQTCSLDKLTSYPEDYLDFYCLPISDTNKAYSINNKTYKEFDNINFDRVILNIRQNVIMSTVEVNRNSLCFIKQLNDPLKAKDTYRQILKSFKLKYGSRASRFQQKNVIPDTDCADCLDESCPFAKEEITSWRGESEIEMYLIYVQEKNLILLIIEDNGINRAWLNKQSLYKDSEYEENFKDAFKEFDKRKEFKGLKFGTNKINLAPHVQIELNNQKGYDIVNKEYNNWFDIKFDLCNIGFNKKNQFYTVLLFKSDFSNDEYEKLLRDFTSLFGSSNIFKELKGDNIWTIWSGKNIDLNIMRPVNNNIICIRINCFPLDDSSPTDKLY